MLMSMNTIGRAEEDIWDGNQGAESPVTSHPRGCDISTSPIYFMTNDLLYGGRPLTKMGSVEYSAHFNATPGFLPKVVYTT